jgi:hypothetical protein
MFYNATLATAHRVVREVVFKGEEGAPCVEAEDGEQGRPQHLLMHVARHGAGEGTV